MNVNWTLDELTTLAIAQGWTVSDSGQSLAFRRTDNSATIHVAKRFNGSEGGRTANNTIAMLKRAGMEFPDRRKGSVKKWVEEREAQKQMNEPLAIATPTSERPGQPLTMEALALEMVRLRDELDITKDTVKAQLDMTYELAEQFNTFRKFVQAEMPGIRANIQKLLDKPWMADIDVVMREVRKVESGIAGHVQRLAQKADPLAAFKEMMNR